MSWVEILFYGFKFPLITDCMRYAMKVKCRNFSSTRVSDGTIWLHPLERKLHCDIWDCHFPSESDVDSPRKRTQAQHSCIIGKWLYVATMLWLQIFNFPCLYSYRSSILSEVSTRSRSKLPSGKNVLLLGEWRSIQSWMKFLKEFLRFSESLLLLGTLASTPLSRCCCSSSVRAPVFPASCSAVTLHFLLTWPWATHWLQF